MDIETLAYARNEGYNAFNEDRSGAPSLSPVIREMTKDMPVGTGAAAIFNAFLVGFNDAANVECARILAEG